MRLVCRECSAVYEAPDSLFGPQPREVRCNRCGYQWTVIGAPTEDGSVPVTEQRESPVDLPAPATAPAPAPRETARETPGDTAGDAAGAGLRPRKLTPTLRMPTAPSPLTSPSSAPAPALGPVRSAPSTPTSPAQAATAPVATAPRRSSPAAASLKATPRPTGLAGRDAAPPPGAPPLTASSPTASSSATPSPTTALRAPARRDDKIALRPNPEDRLVASEGPRPASFAEPTSPSVSALFTGTPGAAPAEVLPDPEERRLSHELDPSLSEHYAMMQNQGGRSGRLVLIILLIAILAAFAAIILKVELVAAFPALSGAYSSIGL